MGIRRCLNKLLHRRTRSEGIAVPKTAPSTIVQQPVPAAVEAPAAEVSPRYFQPRQGNAVTHIPTASLLTGR
jgi:hypothetical protein